MQGISNLLAESFWPDIASIENLPSVSMSRKLRTMAGGYDPNANHIVLAHRYFQVHGGYVLIGTLLHELCHWAVHMMGGCDKPHGKEWQVQAEKVGLDPNDIHCESGW